MVSSGHVQEIFVHALPGNQSHNALDRKWSSVNKIAVEQVLVFVSRVAVDFENVH